MLSPATGTAPLAAHPALASQDLDEVRQHGARVFCPHRLQLAGAAQQLDTRLFHRRLGGIGLGRLSYGATVDIDPGALEQFYLLQWPRQGAETVHLGGAEVCSSTGMGSLVSPGPRFHMQHHAGTDKLFVRIDRAALARQVQALAPGDSGPPVVFAPALPWAEPRLAALAGLLRWLFDAASHGPALDHPLLAASAEDLLLRTLLQALAHNRPDLLRPQPALAPAYVRRAEAHMAEHADQPLTVADLALHAGVSVRSLYAAFRRYRGCSPMDSLRALRLQRCHQALRAAGDAPATTVTDVALRWGFGHGGQFAADYRARFGELPSQTLRRARGG